MSGIAALFDPGRAMDLAPMARAIRPRGPDGLDLWREGPVGLAHAHFWTVPEEEGERQPLAWEGLRIAADARIDNREELLPALRDLLDTPSPSDARLILAAYRKWGRACLEWLVGDFAFALWDTRRRVLFCARDPVGIRPLFYAGKGTAFLAASTPQALVAGLGQRPPLNEPLLVDYLSHRFERWVGETAYEGIMRLPAAHAMEIGELGMRIWRYWEWGRAPDTPLSEGEAAEAFRERLTEAVRARLRSLSPVALSLSGGFDSSSIACLAHDLGATVRTYSWVFQAYQGGDERRYLEAVLERCPHFPATYLDGDRELWGMRGIENPPRFQEPGISLLWHGMQSLQERARGDGCRVILLGEGADQVLSGDAYAAPQLLADAGWGFQKELPHFARPGWSRLAGQMAREALRPLIPSPILRKMRARRHLGAIPPWVREWRPGPPPEPKTSQFPDRTRALMHRQLTGGWYAALLSQADAGASWTPVEYRLPYLDRRVVDFLFTLPAHLRWRDGFSKILLRRADILPELFRGRRRCAHMTEPVFAGFQKEDRAIRALAGRMEGWIDTERWERAWKDVGPGSWRTLSAPLLLQLWLEGEDDGRKEGRDS